MTAEQASEIYEGLTRLLREYGLSWIVHEVQSVVTEGKTEVRQATHSPGEAVTRTKRPGRNFSHVQRDWTSEERLALLLEAIEVAVAGRALLASDIISVLPDLRGHWIEFAPDGLARDGYSVALDGSVADRVVIAQQLTKLLQTVRRDLNADLD